MTGPRYLPFLRAACASVALSVGLGANVAAADEQAFAQLCTRHAAPVLEASGRQLLRDGEPSFLVLVSYFDAMRATQAAIESDFAFLKSRGIDGVRIFPLWMYTGQRPEATLLDEDGVVRSTERWDHFTAILRKAAACGLVVDVTFNREQLATVGEFTVAEFQRGLVELVWRLQGDPAYSHVFIDLQNERGHPNSPAMQLSTAEVRRLRDAVKRADPRRLLMMSTQGGVSASVELVALADLDLIAFHELQRTDWHDTTASIVQALKVGGVPIYLQEMARAPDRGVKCERETPEVNPLAEALRKARAAGAAAWTMHTAAAFRLDTDAFQTRIRACPREIDFLDTLRARHD